MTKRRVKPMSTEKMWYSFNEVEKLLDMDKITLTKKLTLLNFDEPRTLPGEKGTFIAARDVEKLRAMISPRATPKQDAPQDTPIA